MKLKEVPFESLREGDRVLLPDGQVYHISELFSDRHFVICREDGTGEILLHYDNIRNPAHPSASMGEITYLGAAS